MTPGPRETELLRALAERFPKRPLQVRHTGTQSPLAAMLCALVCFAVAAAIAWIASPGLMTDWRLRHGGVFVEGDIVGGCKRSGRGLMVDCEATLKYEVDGRRYEVEREFTYFGRLDDEYRVGIVRSASDPGVATLDHALTFWWRRLWTAFAGIALCGGVGVWGLFELRRARHFRRHYGSDARRTLKPVLVRITRAITTRYSKAVTYNYKPTTTARKPTLRAAINPVESHPLILSGSYALAVVADGAEHLPILLDAGLTRLDLSDEERAQLLGQLQA